MASSHPGRQILERVALRLGGLENASHRLGISPGLLTRFLNGTLPVPDQILLAAADLLLADTGMRQEQGVRQEQTEGMSEGQAAE
jgi:hypothetical protein